MHNEHIILGIETSCDETGIAVYQRGKGLRSNVLFSQSDFHATHGGVIPEIASRTQLEKIGPVFHAALERADVSLADIDVVAVTCKPGLAGSLLVGLCFAKALAWSAHKKLIGVNHLEGHIFSAFLEHAVPFPHLCLTASGGHTALYIVHDFGTYELLGQTQDDAAGEAFDKIAKLVGLPYPGGPVLERTAAQVSFQDFFCYPRAMYNSLDFSFSGVKTAVLYDLVKRGAYDISNKRFLKASDDSIVARVASSFHVCVGDMFEHKLRIALRECVDVKAITFVGGVACNTYIKNRLATFARNHNLAFFSPSAAYCTDNGAMIAFVGSYKALQNKYADFTLDIFDTAY
jgi:N6-L-threonylcarbamoyladenine synthase